MDDNPGMRENLTWLDAQRGEWPPLLPLPEPQPSPVPDAEAWLTLIAGVVLEETPAVAVLLFGSRARGYNRPDATATSR